MKDKLKKIIITTKRSIFSDLKANHPSIFNGDGLDFSELREYQSGEDSKRIDYKTTAKKNTPYVRVYKEEKELNIVTISCLGGGVAFGSKISKQELIAKIVSIIGYSAIRYQDKFSSYIFTDKIDSGIKPTKKLPFVTRAIEQIVEFNPIGKEVEFEKLEKEILKYIKKKSIIFLISDFYEIVNLKKLNTIHEVIALIIRDNLEENLPQIGYANLCDASTKKYTKVNIDENFTKNYKKLINRHDHQLYESLKNSRVRFAKIYTDENPIKSLRKMFMSRV